MNMQTIINCFLISIGAIIMLISIIKTKDLMKAIPFVPKRQQKQIKHYLVLHRCLMVFFCLGYLVVLVAFAFSYLFVSETFVSVIFFFGAIFVFIGIDIQSRLLSEVQTTLQGILPICSKCKKIRTKNGDSTDPKAWKIIEQYIAEKTDVDFSHGYCPECLRKEMEKIDRME